MSQEFESWEEFEYVESNVADLAVTRFWPLAMTSTTGLSSLFLPWIQISRTSGTTFTWSPINFLPIGLIFVAAIVVVGVIAYREWSTKAVSPTITRLILLLTGVALSVVALAFELLCSSLSALGIVIHYHSWALAMSSGIGLWLAAASAWAGLIGTLPNSYFPNLIQSSMTKRLSRVAPSSLLLVGTAIVVVGRNSSWFRIGWGQWRLGVASWAIPFVGSELRVIAVCWLVCLFVMRWAPLSARTVLVFCELATFFYGQIVRTFGPSISLNFVNQLVGTHYGQFHSSLSYGVSVVQIGCVFAGIGTLWQMKRLASAEHVLSVVEESA